MLVYTLNHLGAPELLFGSHKHRPCFGLHIQALHPVASIRRESSKRDARPNWIFFPKVTFFCHVFMLEGYPVFSTPQPVQKKGHISTEVCEHLPSLQWEEQIEADSSLDPVQHMK